MPMAVLLEYCNGGALSVSDNAVACKQGSQNRATCCVGAHYSESSGHPLGPDSQQLEGSARGPLLVFELPKSCIRANAIWVQRQSRHKPDLQVRLALPCTTSCPGSCPCFKILQEICNQRWILYMI